MNVYLDDQYAFALPAVEAAHLKMGQHLDDAEIARLKALDLTAKAYDRALRFLSVRPRSVTEVRRNLEEAGYDEDAITATVARLTEHGYLNDADFAQFWVENRQRFRPKGPQALRQELRQRGVDRETIDQSLGELDQSAAAYEAGRARAQRLEALAATDPLTFRRKLGEFLMRRGFDYAIVEEVVQRLLREATA